MEFKEANTGTKEVRLLDSLGDKLEATFRKGLGINTSLLPHMTILGWRGPESAKMLRFLCSKPGALEAKNENGLTPALYAVRGGHVDAVKTLVELGADFTARDKHGRNLLHMLLVPWKEDAVNDYSRIFRAKKILKLIPRDIVVDCTTQRTMGFLRTPLASWLQNGDAWPVLTEVLAPYTNWAELLMADSQGNAPIHMVSHPFFQSIDPVHSQGANTSIGRPPELA